MHMLLPSKKNGKKFWTNWNRRNNICDDFSFSGGSAESVDLHSSMIIDEKLWHQYFSFVPPDLQLGWRLHWIEASVSVPFFVLQGSTPQVLRLLHWQPAMKQFLHAYLCEANRSCKFIYFKRQLQSVFIGGSKGGSQGHIRSGSDFFFFHAVFGRKNWPNNRLAY